MMHPLLTLEERGLGWGVRAASCPAEQLARQVGGDSLSCHPSIHCPRTSESSLAFGDRQLLWTHSGGRDEGTGQAGPKLSPILLHSLFQNHLWHPQLCGSRSAAETGPWP